MKNGVFTENFAKPNLPGIWMMSPITGEWLELVEPDDYKKDGYDWFFDFNMHFLGLTKEEARLSMQEIVLRVPEDRFVLAYTWAVTLNTMLALEGTGAEHFDLFSRLITLMEDRATKENISLDNLPEVGFDIPQSLLLTGFLDMNGNKPFSDHDAFDMYYFWHLTYLAATRIEAQMEEIDVLRYIPESRLIRAYYTCKEQEKISAKLEPDFPGYRSSLEAIENVAKERNIKL